MTTPVTASTALVDAAQAERFASSLEAVWPARERAGARLGVAVSGGPDSTALLLLAAASLNGEVEAATVDHGLRPESAAEAEAVAALCGRLGVAHATLPVEVAPGNLQSEARVARYAALGQWMEARGLGALATAHHADDQAETLLLRLNRASGVAGLAGARARGVVPDTRLLLVRPLLGWRRSELTAIVEQAGVSAADDPSNRDDRFDRARIRKALAGADWIDVAAVAQSAGHLADADAALDWAARREWTECVREEGLGIVYRPQAPRAVALRVLARIVDRLGDGEVRGGALAGLFETLVAGRPASVGSLVARPGPGGWSFAKAPRRAVRRNQE
jgi:tRNA(Ile)-lysidine synthase